MAWTRPIEPLIEVVLGLWFLAIILGTTNGSHSSQKLSGTPKPVRNFDS